MMMKKINISVLSHLGEYIFIPLIFEKTYLLRRIYYLYIEIILQNILVSFTIKKAETSFIDVIGDRKMGKVNLKKEEIKKEILKRYLNITEDFQKSRLDSSLWYVVFDISEERTIVKIKGYTGKMYVFLYWTPEMGTIENAINFKWIRIEIGYLNRIENEEKKEKEVRKFLNKNSKNISIFLDYLDSEFKDLLKNFIEKYQ